MLCSKKAPGGLKQTANLISRVGGGGKGSFPVFSLHSIITVISSIINYFFFEFKEARITEKNTKLYHYVPPGCQWGWGWGNVPPTPVGFSTDVI